MKIVYALFIMIFVFNVFAQDNSSDTLVVDSKGYGATKEESVKDAIRNAAESSVGVLITSQTMIDNYITVRDNILTSANAYVYRYEDKNTSFDKNTNVYETEIRAFIAKKLLQTNVNAKINENLSIDLTPIQKAKFEMEQARNRATSALVYQAAYLQKNFRNVFIPRIDSLVLKNKNFMDMYAKPVIYCSFKVNDYNRFRQEYASLVKRSSSFANKEYYALGKITFNVKSPRNAIIKSGLSIDITESKQDLISLLKSKIAAGGGISVRSKHREAMDLVIKSSKKDLMSNGLLIMLDNKVISLKDGYYKFKIDLNYMEMEDIELISFYIDYQINMLTIPLKYDWEGVETCLYFYNWSENSSNRLLFFNNMDKDLSKIIW